MSGLSTSPRIPHQRQPILTPEFQLQSDLLDATPTPLLTCPANERPSGKRAKHQRSKGHRKRRKQHLGAYILQIIGLICLVLAAVKAFEPLTGVGFTLVMVGYKGAVGDGDAGDISKMQRKGRQESKKSRREQKAEQKELR